MTDPTTCGFRLAECNQELFVPIDTMQTVIGAIQLMVAEGMPPEEIQARIMEDVVKHSKNLTQQKKPDGEKLGEEKIVNCEDSTTIQAKIPSPVEVNKSETDITDKTVKTNENEESLKKPNMPPTGSVQTAPDCVPSTVPSAAPEPAPASKEPATSRPTSRPSSRSSTASSPPQVTPVVSVKEIPPPKEQESQPPPVQIPANPGRTNSPNRRHNRLTMPSTVASFQSRTSPSQKSDTNKSRPSRPRPKVNKSYEQLQKFVVAGSLICFAAFGIYIFYKTRDEQPPFLDRYLQK